MKARTVSRRKLLTTAGAGLLGATITSGSVGRALAEKGFDPPPKTRLAADVAPADLPQPDKEMRLLGRTSFGITPDDVERIEDLGYNGYIKDQLNLASVTDPADAQAASLFPSILLDIDEMDFEDRIQIVVDLKSATLYRALNSGRQLFEVMVDFWSDHFSVFHGDGPVTFFKTVDDREVIRGHALDSCGDLLQASAKSPAMLYYLDNYANQKDGPNENYARELLELHTLGVDGGYTQEDVEEVARCFTGWTIANRRAEGMGEFGDFVFAPQFHDYDAKKVLGKKISSGGGMSDGVAVLNLLAEQKSTSEHIAAKLVRRFVDDNPPNTLVKKAAKTYRKKNGSISEVVETILKNKKFKNADDAKVKRPFDFICSALRCLEADVSSQGFRALLPWLRNMGHLPFDWPAPNGYPDAAGAWVNTNGLMNRWNFGLSVGASVLPGVVVNYDRILDEADASSAAEVVDHFAERILRRKLRNADRDLLEDYVANGQSTNSKLSRTRIKLRLPGLVALLVDSPYFQYR